MSSMTQELGLPDSRESLYYRICQHGVILVLEAPKVIFEPRKIWIEALEHSCFLRPPVLCYIFQTVSEIALQQYRHDLQKKYRS